IIFRMPGTLDEPEVMSGYRGYTAATSLTDTQELAAGPYTYGVQAQSVSGHLSEIAIAHITVTSPNVWESGPLGVPALQGGADFVDGSTLGLWGAGTDIWG